MQPADIAGIVTVSDPTLSPDGRLIAYVVSRVDMVANRYRSAVWLVPTDGSKAPWPLTAGAESDTAPAWSPDSRRLAFTRSHEATGTDATYTLAVIPVGGPGETVTLAERDEAIEDPAWSPDGRTIAFSSRVRGERYAQGDDDRARPPRRITRLLPRLDSVGWIIDRPSQLFVVPADGSAQPRRVTADDVDYGAPSWAPDSRRVATAAARHEDADLDNRNDVWIVDTGVRHGGRLAADSDPLRVTGTDAWYQLPAWQPDGDQIAVHRAVDEIGYRHSQVAIVAAGGGSRTILTASLDRGCAPYPGTRSPVWRADTVLFAIEDRGRVPLLEVESGGSASPRRLVDADRWITGYDASGDVVVFTATGADKPPELFVARGGEEHQLTHHQDAFTAACPPLAPERFEVTASDGTVLDAWALLPPGYDPRQRYAALLNIHGGPHTQYGERWLDEFQIYASAGYVVLYANPRGSTGYSEQSARVLLSRASTEDPGEGWGPPAFADLMLVMDAALERYPAIEATRLGVMGGSYGGYLTTWIVGHTDRFAAACSERAANNLSSLEWSSDAGGSFRYAMGVPLLDAPEEWARLSPLTYVRDITTPLLILHSEEDLRCPPEQADALWVALRLLRRDVDYYRFPAESHELTRSGSPRHRVQRAELLLDWFARRLGPESTWD